MANILLKIRNSLGAIINPATAEAQTDGSQKTQVVGTVPLPTGASTETTLIAVKNLLLQQRELATSLWTDDSGATYIRKEIYDEGAGSSSIVYTNAAGATVTPGAGLRPLAGLDKEVIEQAYTATAGGTGYSTDDILGRVLVVDTSVSPPGLEQRWLNITTGVLLASPPTAGTVTPFGAGDATEATLNLINAQLPPHSRGLENEQVSSLAPTIVWEGAFMRVDRVPHFEFLYAAPTGTPYTLQKVWSNDGVNAAGAASTLTQSVEQGYSVVYDVNEGRNDAAWVRYRVINGAVGQGIPNVGFITRCWLFKTPYQGQFLGLKASLNNLSRGLLTIAVAKSYDPRGNFVLERSDQTGAKRVVDDRFSVSQSRAIRTQGVRKDVDIKFFSGTLVNDPEGIYDDGSVNGGVTFDATNGRAVFAVPATLSSRCIYRSMKTALYASGDPIFGEQSFEIAALPVENEVIRWGFGNGSHAIGWRLDATGLWVERIKNGVVAYQQQQPNWNRDPCGASTDANINALSGYTLNFAPVILTALSNVRYGEEFDWLGTSPPGWQVVAPNKRSLDVNVEEFIGPGTTVPTPNLPLYIDIRNNTSGTARVLSVASGSWHVDTQTSRTDPLDVENVASLGANDAYVDLDTTGRAVISCEITGTFGARVNFEAKIGNNWYPIQMRQAGTDQAVSFVETSNLVLRGTASGWARVRARLSNFTSGAAVVRLRTTTTTGIVMLSGPAQIAPCKTPVTTSALYGTSPARADTGAANRKAIEFHPRAVNPNNSFITVGWSAGIGTLTGSRAVTPGESWTLDVSAEDANVQCYIIASDPNVRVDVTELFN